MQQDQGNRLPSQSASHQGNCQAEEVFETSTSKIGFVNDPVPPVPDAAPDVVPPMSALDESPPPTARAGLVVPSPELPSSSEDENDRRVTAAPRGGRHDLRPYAASRSASQPIATPSAKEVYLDSDSDMLY